MPEPAHSPRPTLLLGIDTCGPTGSVALGECGGRHGELGILGETELAGRSYSATLVTAISGLLQSAETAVSRIDAIVVVNGPGSFTGVRVGLSAVKGLAAGLAELAILSVSRLEVLAAKAGTASSALDAHRGEVFLRIGARAAESRELLAGAQDLAAIISRPARIALCDNSAAEMLRVAWPDAEQERVAPPTAADALALCARRVIAGERVDVALLDGHYLRRSDAEIFGDSSRAEPRGK